jgi:hypothetical protein
MADFGQFFDPQAAGAAVAPNGVEDLKNRWSTFLNDPTTQAAMLSTAGQLAQPMQWGQSGFGHLMSAIGQGGESVRKTDELRRKEEELDIKREDAESKAGLREAQATSAEARAAAAGERASGASTRLQLEEMRQEGARERHRLGGVIQINRLYNDYIRGVQRTNADPLNRTPVPVLTQEEWLQTRPELQAIMLGGSPSPSAPGGAGSPPGRPASGSPPAPTGGTPPATAPQGPPPPPAQRQDGMIYPHPQHGRLRWDASQQRWFPVGQ